MIYLHTSKTNKSRSVFNKSNRMAGKIMEIKENLNKFLHEKGKPWTSILGQAEAKTGVDRLYIFVGKYKFIT